MEAIVKSRIFSNGATVKMVLAATVAAGALLCGASWSWGQATSATAATSAAPAVSTAPAAAPEATVNLNELPNPLPLQLFVDYVGMRLQLKFIYDAADLGGTINLGVPSGKLVKISELNGLLEDVLRTKNLVMVPASHGEWIRILQSAKASMFTGLLPPNTPSGPAQGETIVTETMSLQYISPQDMQDALLPYMSPDGFVVPMPDRHMLQITEYKSRVDDLRQFIKLMDVPVKKFEKRDIPLKYVKSSDMQTRLQAFITARQGKVTKLVPNKQPTGKIVWIPGMAPAEMPPFIDVNERTNALVMIGVPGDLDDLAELVAMYDVPRINLQEVKFYPLQYQAADDVVTVITALGLLGPDLNTSGGAGRRTGAGASRPASPAGPAAPAGGGGTMLYGTGAPPKLTVMESQNTLILVAMPDEQKIVADFVKQVDTIPSEFGAIRVYPLSRRNADDVATMLKSVMGAGSVDPRTKAALPGVEGAPTIVSLTDINAVIASASPQQQEDIARLIAQIDASQPQVLLEATLLEVTDGDNFNLGIELENFRLNSAGGITSPYAGSALGLVNPTVPQLGIKKGATSVSGSGTVAGAGSSLGGSIAFLSDGQVLALLQAVDSKTKSRTLSKPRMLVNNNYKNAILQSVDEQPTTSLDALTSNVTTVSFKGYTSAGTKLQITPMISDGNFIKLDIDLEVSAFTGPGSADGSIPPPQSDRTLTTEVTVPDQMTVVVGGLKGRNKTEGTTQIPVLGDIPILGELFKSHANTYTNTTDYLFVKASILRDVSFEDMIAETRDTRGVLPKDIRELDPSISEESARKEAERLNAVIRKRALEKKAAEAAALEAEAKTHARGIGASGTTTPAPTPAPTPAAPEQAPVVPQSSVPATPGK